MTGTVRIRDPAVVIHHTVGYACSRIPLYGRAVHKDTEKLQDPIRIHRDPYGIRCQPCGLSTVKMTDAERKPVRHKRPFLL